MVDKVKHVPMYDNHTIAPIHLFPLVEAYCSPAKESCPHLMRSTGSCAPLKELMELGLIERRKDVDKDCHGYSITEKGRVFVDAILSTPMPESRWIIPERKSA